MGWRAVLGLIVVAYGCNDRTDAGQRCRADAECGELACGADLATLPTDLAPLPLACAAATSAAVSGEACEQANDCAQAICLLAGACALPCRDDRDCDPDATCVPAYARSGDDRYATLAACVPRVSLPSDAQVATEVRRGALTSGTVTLELPPPLAATTLYVLEHLDDDTWPVPDEQSLCRPPLCASRLATAEATPRILFDRSALADESDGPDNPIATGSQIVPLDVLVPNGPRAPLSAAGYQIDVEAKQPGDLRLTRLARDERGRRLDLNLYYVGAGDLVVSGTRGIPALSDALDEVDRIFAQADIMIGEVRQVSVTGALLQRGTPLPDAEVSAGFEDLLSQYGVLPQLPELFKLSAGASNSALDVFFVADIDASDGDVGGISGGTPIPFGMHGSPGSGVVIAADMFFASGDTAAFGLTLAHELGHALGLFHTTELEGTIYDPLPDTPVCVKSRDANHDGLLDANECDGEGADNLMFPTSDATDSLLTPDQSAVLQRALILQ
ncbi:MAG TPA: hypothetical protein VHZ95_00230 [Polyangiales bacterium]|nr:hypothetical protein [Polyangiales bacterium]